MFIFIILIFPGVSVMFSALFPSIFDNVILILGEELVFVINPFILHKTWNYIVCFP